MRSRESLRDAQLDIIAALTDNADQMVIAGMGGGKTSSLLTAFSDLQSQGEVRRGVILAPPLVTATVWPREPSRWDHLSHLRVDTLNGSPAQRLKMLKESTADLIAVPTTLTKWFCQASEALDDDNSLFDMLAIDEIGLFTDPSGVHARSLMPDNRVVDPKARVAARFKSRVGLTGSVRPNGWLDVYQPYRIISAGEIWKDVDGKVQNFTDWRLDNFRPKSAKGYDWAPHRFAVREFEKTLAPWTTSIDVGDLGLPALNTGEDWDYFVRLKPAAQEAYDQMLHERLLQVGFTGKVDEDFVTAMSAGVQSGKLVQIIQGFIMDRDPGEDGMGTSSVVAEFNNAKLDMLREIVSSREAGSPLMIAFHYKQDLMNIQSVIPNIPVIGSGVSIAKAKATMGAFAKSELPFLAIHPFSASHGIDELQFGGREILWYCPTWSADRYDQLVKRLHRPGQKWPVISRRIIAEDTLDEVKASRVEGKMSDEEAFRKLFRKKGLVI